MTPGPRTCLLGGEGGRPVSPWQPRGPTRPYGRFLAAGGSSQEGGGGDARVEGDGGAGVQAPPSRWEPPSPPPRPPSVPSAPPRGCRRDGPALVCACMLQGRGRPPARWRGRPRGRAARGPARGKDEGVGFGGGAVVEHFLNNVKKCRIGILGASSLLPCMTQNDFLPRRNAEKLIQVNLHITCNRVSANPTKLIKRREVG